MKGIRRLLQGIALLLALVVVGALGFRWGRASGARGTGVPADLGPAPAYTLTNQLGQTVKSSAFRGKVQVVSFLFPYCTTICPLIAAHLTNFVNLALKPAGLADRVQLVTFNVDPVGTGPRQMRAFLQQYGWDPRDLRWQYLTGRPDAVRRVVTKGFHVSYRRVTFAEEAREAGSGPAIQQPDVANALAARAHVDYDIVHNDVVEIVGPRGHIRDIYTDGDVLSPQRLLAAVKALLPAAAKKSG